MDQLEGHVVQKSEQVGTIFVIVSSLLIIRGWYFFEAFLHFKYFDLKRVGLQIPFFHV